MQTALLFTVAQLNLIIIVAVVFAALFAANSVLLILFFYKRKKSRLCTDELQQRREQLLEELAQLKFLIPREEDDETAEIEELDDIEDETGDDMVLDDETDGKAPDLEGECADAEDEFNGEIAASDIGRLRLKVLAVCDMSPLMRQNLGFAGKAFDNKRYYVRYTYGFEAKLRSSGADVKERYGNFIEEIGRYKKLSLARGFRQQRIYVGRKTVGLILFKGKTLCVALALNPQKYENTKYSGIDVSEIKRFKKTPMLIKITSARRLVYAKYLLNRLAEENIIAMRAQPEKIDFSSEESDECGYYAEGLLKIAVIGEVPDGAAEE